MTTLTLQRSAQLALVGYFAVACAGVMLLRPGPKEVSYGHISSPQPVGIPWNDARNIVIDHRGVRISGIPSLAPMGRVELSADGNDVYELRFESQGEVVEHLEVNPYLGNGMILHLLPLPESLRTRPCDAVVVAPMRGDGAYSLGYLRFLP